MTQTQPYDPNNPLSAALPSTTAAPSTPGQPGNVQAPPLQPAPNSGAPTPDPFAAMGGGFWTGQQWVPSNHPLAQPGAGQPPTQPGAPAAGGVPPPTPYTSTPDMQQLQRQQLIALIGQNAVPAADDPIIKRQSEVFAAGQQRAAKQAQDEAAEAAGAEGMGSSGALELRKRAASERAGNAIGAFEADLTNREYVRRKQEIQDYMKMNAATIDADQQRMLQRELAQLDAALRRQGYDVQTSLGNRELDIRNDLGQKGIQNDLMRLLLSNNQFNNQLGFQIGATEAQLNNSALRSLFGG